MRLSLLIEKLTELRAELGDVNLVVERDDGYSTYRDVPSPSITYRKQWRDHPDDAANYISL